MTTATRNLNIGPVQLTLKPITIGPWAKFLIAIGAGLVGATCMAVAMIVFAACGPGLLRGIILGLFIGVAGAQSVNYALNKMGC